MSIENVNVVDDVVVDKATDKAVLIVFDHLAWNDEEHFILLHSKIDSYLGFIESGEILESYPDAQGRVFRIDVVCELAPDAEGERGLEEVAQIVHQAGLSFCWRVLDGPNHEFIPDEAHVEETPESHGYHKLPGSRQW